MKALLIKDLKTVTFFLIFIAVFSLLSSWSGSMYIGMIYVLMLPILVINQDELTKFNRLVSMMPISSATVVLEKYVLVLIGLGAALVFTALGMVVGTFVMGIDVFASGLIGTLLMQLIMLFIYIAVTMPINFAVSSQVGRTVCMIVSLVIVGVAFGIWTGLSRTQLFDYRSPTFYIVMAGSLVLCLLSIPLTIAIYTKKDK
ncbi:MAG: ABC-2 transporter permease [Treponema sp.]|nr:ABC-2 transporter permease [Treponema sp.]MBR7079442.1 ABC-2 transporter permease [Treponema sp.]